MKKEEKLTENIIAILELNKRKWDEEHPSKHDENTINNLVDKHQDVPKSDKRKATKLVNKDVSKVDKHDFPKFEKFEKKLKKDKLSIVSFRLPIALKETIDYYCEEGGINRTDYFHRVLSEFKIMSLENLELKKMLLELEKSYIEKINMKSVQNLGKNLKNIKNIKDILSYPNLTIKELLGEVVDDNDMPNFLEKLNEMDIDKIISGDSKWIEIIRDFKQKENKENKSEYSSPFNSNFFNSESVAESKSKNIVLNISSSINLNVSNLNEKETINLTINVS
jgi:hypothetical protein